MTITAIGIGISIFTWLPWNPPIRELFLLQMITVSLWLCQVVFSKNNLCIFSIERFIDRRSNINLHFMTWKKYATLRIKTLTLTWLLVVSVHRYIINTEIIQQSPLIKSDYSFHSGHLLRLFGKSVYFWAWFLIFVSRQLDIVKRKTFLSSAT